MTNDSDSRTDMHAAIAELDAAMREREAIDAAEHDRALLAAYWAGRTGKKPQFFASRLIAFVVAGACMLLSGAALADETKKPKRPTLCMSGTPVTGERFAGFLCTDGKRPKLFTRYIEVQFVNEAGEAASYVLGWTGAATKPIPLPKRLPKDVAPSKPASIKL